MFDPTVFDNLKVVLEGAVYDLDLAGFIRIASREDLIDLASLSRTYRLSFRLPEEEHAPLRSAAAASAEIVLSAGLADLAAELSEKPGASPGCFLEMAFSTVLQPDEDEAQACVKAESILAKVWGSRFQVRQTLSWEYGREPKLRSRRISLQFGRSFGEGLAEDIPELADHALLTLRLLKEG